MKIDIRRLRQFRLQRTQSYVKRSGLGAIIVNTWDNVRYVTDVRPVLLTEWYSDGHHCVVTSNNEPTVYGYYSGDNLSAKFVDSSPFPFFSPMILPDKWADSMADLLRELGITSGNVGLDYLPYALELKLRSRLPNVEFVPIFDELLRLRAVKNEEEIKLIREAARIVDLEIAKGIESLKAGISELDVFAQIVATTIRWGSKGYHSQPF
jgi:Xaa-Pro aminopeptidase